MQSERGPSVKYSKHEAKAYARENMRGIWAAALNPFNDDLTLDEEGLRANICHWIDDLDILASLSRASRVSSGR